MKKTFLGLIMFFGAGVVYSQVVSDFDVVATGIDGWNTFGDGGGAGPGVPIYQSTGGNPGGCIKQTDGTVGIWYWYGPSKFRGDLSAYNNCNLSFDLKQDHISVPVSAYDVMIFNTGTDTMVFNTSPDPSPVNTWESYIVPLTTGVGWKYGSSIAGGAPNATAAQILAILSDVKRIRIRAEYEGLWSETDYLDNVMLSCAVVLPVELTDFTAVIDGPKRSKLTWTTQSELNCAGFEIEKSTDLGTYEAIGYMEGHGTTTEQNTYEFYDYDFSNSAYYRLREVDNLGKLYYSKLVYLKAPEPETSSTVIYPNPANDYLTLSVEDADPVQQVRILDVSGRVIYFESVHAYAGTYQNKIDLSLFPEGLYSIVVNTANGTETRPFEIIR